MKNNFSAVLSDIPMLWDRHVAEIRSWASALCRRTAIHFYLMRPIGRYEIMNAKPHRTLMSLIGFIGALSSPYVLADELIVRAFHLDRVREPKSLANTVQECLNNPICKNALSAAATSMGVPPNAVKFASAVTKIAHVAGGTGDDEQKFDWWAPNGYQLCRLSIDVVSTVPTDSSGALLDVSFEQNKNHIVTYVPIQSLGRGRAWVEADMVATYVSDAAAAARRNDGTCAPLNQGNPPPWVYRCRGTGGDGQGRQACGSLRH